MMMCDGEYTVRLIDLPASVNGVIAYDSDGYPNIYINSRISSEAQRLAVIHELRHCHRDDVYNSLPIRAAEGG